MPSAILTDGATFSCPHGGTGTVASGIISVSPVASIMTIGGHKPILAGATVTGFTAASGCTFVTPPPTSVSQPCVGFALPAPSEQTMTIGGQAVYTVADASAIATVPSTGNGIPGLTINEPQTVGTA